MSHRTLKMSLLIASLALLTACGGGSATTTASEYPLDTALSAYHQMSHTYLLNGSQGSDDYALGIIIAPGPQSSFDGIQAMTETDAFTETKNGAAFGSGANLEFFLTSPYTQIGANVSNSLFELDLNQQKLPELADAPSKGPLDSQKYYSDGTFKTQVATGTRTWTLTALTSDTAQFCSHDTDDIGGPTETEVDCYSLDIKGNITALEITETSGGQTIVFK
jgi:hypothetical protein